MVVLLLVLLLRRQGPIHRGDDAWEALRGRRLVLLAPQVDSGAAETVSLAANIAGGAVRLRLQAKGFGRRSGSISSKGRRRRQRVRWRRCVRPGGKELVQERRDRIRVQGRVREAGRGAGSCGSRVGGGAASRARAGAGLASCVSRGHRRVALGGHTPARHSTVCAME